MLRPFVDVVLELRLQSLTATSLIRVATTEGFSARLGSHSRLDQPLLHSMTFRYSHADVHGSITIAVRRQTLQGIPFVR